MSENTKGWWADDGSGGPLHYPEATTAREAAEEYCDCDWDGYVGPILVLCWREDEDGERLDECSHEVLIECSPPDCAEGCAHDWQAPHIVVGGIEENPGVYGSGGGVRYTEVCPHCGTYKKGDTWATGPTGEPYHKVWYESPDDTSVAWVLTHKVEAVCADLAMALNELGGGWRSCLDGIEDAIERLDPSRGRELCTMLLDDLNEQAADGPQMYADAAELAQLLIDTIDERWC
jgi:hypothetical protein